MDFSLIDNFSIPNGNVSVLHNGHDILWYAKLPAAYTELDYIEGTGTQWIDTGVYGNQDIGIDVTYQYPDYVSSSASARIIGTRETSSGATGSCCFVSTSTGEARGTMWFATNNVQLASGQRPSLNKLVNNIQSNVNNDKAFYLNGTLMFTGNDTPFTGTLPIPIFRNASLSTYSDPGCVRVYRVIIYDDGVPIRMFVPALRNSDNAGGMYEMFTNSFYGNSGTGDFHYDGYVPSGYRSTQFVEGDGSHYIDTLITPTQTTDWEVDFQLTNISEYSSETTTVSGNTFGVMQTNGSYYNRDHFGYWHNRTTPEGWWLGMGYKTGAGDATHYRVTNISGDWLSRHKIRTDKANLTAYLDDTEIQPSFSITTVGTYNDTVTFTLLGRRTSASLVQMCKQKVFGAKFWESGSLIADMVPVQKISDSSFAMYDKIRDTIYSLV